MSTEDQILCELRASADGAAHRGEKAGFAAYSAALLLARLLIHLLKKTP